MLLSGRIGDGAKASVTTLGVEDDVGAATRRILAEAQPVQVLIVRPDPAQPLRDRGSVSTR